MHRRLLPLALLLISGCGTPPPPTIRDGGGDARSSDATIDAPRTEGECADGELNVGEECDDGNTAPDDGCNTACGVEDGWACAGSPSVCTESCGDGEIDAGESCDD